MDANFKPTIPAIIRGVLFQFAARLSSLKEPVTFGASECAAPAADLVAEFIRTTGLGNDSSHVEHNWPELLGVLSGGASDALAERIRQVREEGWTPEHDAGIDHQESELAQAAGYYALRIKGPLASAELFPRNWNPKGMKREGFPYPTDRDLEKAAALIMAELDRRKAAARKGG